MNRWSRYWNDYDVLYGIFQAGVAALIVLSFVGMAVGIIWMR